MAKTIFLIIIVFCFAETYSQNGFIVLKKGQKSIQHFWKDEHFTFLMQNGQWFTGIIRKITNDSFYLTQEIIRYQIMGTDTLHFSGLAYSLSDVIGLPRKNEEIVYDNDMVRVILGREKFDWGKNGFIFQVGGAGYIVVSIINDMARNEPPFAKNNLTGLGIGAAIFMIGTLLHLNFDLYRHLGKKYHLESVIIPDGKR